MRNRKLSNNKICYACGRKLHLHEIEYDPENLKSYCVDCTSPEHPNSPANIKRRGGKKAPMIPARTEEFFASLGDHYDEGTLMDLKDLLGRPLSIRPNPTQVMAVVKVKREKEFTSLNKALGHIIDEYLERREPSQRPVTPMETEEPADVDGGDMVL